MCTVWSPKLDLQVRKKISIIRELFLLYDTPVITYLSRSHRNSVHTTFISPSSAGREVLSWITKWNYFHLVPDLRESKPYASPSLWTTILLFPLAAWDPHREWHSDNPDQEVYDSPYTWEEANTDVLHPGKATVAKVELGKASCHVQDHTRWHIWIGFRAHFRLYKEWALLNTDL